MHLPITGKQTDTGDALRRHVEASLGSILGKYFKTAIEAHVVFSKEAHMSRAEISLHIGRGIVVNAGAAAVDTYTAYDAAAERVAKQLRRYKRRLRDHHATAREPAEASERARDYVLAPVADEADEDAGGGAAVDAGRSTELPNQTGGEAVVRTAVGEAPGLFFRKR